jgi:hypothetical protein
MRLAAFPMAAVVLLALFSGSRAGAERSQEGDLIAVFGGRLSPNALPRESRAPVAVRVAGEVRSAAGDFGQLPQLRRIEVAVNSQGRVSFRGLPSCAVGSIQPATEAEARNRCKRAIVGSGHITVQARLPNQKPFFVEASLLVFNGPRRDGRKLLLAQAYARKPPGAFVLSFVIRRQRGLFGTTLSTTLPRQAQSWAYISRFEMTLRRTYRYRGARHSFVSAACSAPEGFGSAVFPFARATYAFSDGRRLVTSIARRCTVRQSRAHGVATPTALGQ